ncbi:MAG: class I SAM-dependent RNA methyltransferase [Acidimicrobiales bacterium]
MPAPEPVVELRAEKVVAGGEALCREPSGRVVLVGGLLPGETGLVALADERPRLARGRLVSVLDPSPGRITPACRHVARGCGGCPWAHVEPATQRDLKRAVVAEALARTGGIEAEVEPGPVLATDGYRTTLRLAVTGRAAAGRAAAGRAADGPAGGLGFRRARSHDVVDTPDCLVAHPALAELLACVGAPGAREVQLRVGAATGERSATAIGAGRLTGVPAGVATGPEAVVHEVIAGRRLRISAGSFFQTRADGAAALVAVVADGLADAPDGPFLDAYGGVGLFAATVAGDRPVTIVESSRSSCADAAVNLPDARIATVPFERWSPTPAAVVVADPPRAGLGRDGARVLAATGASRVALVSCDPVAHARDLALLLADGFERRRTVLVELFPHTPHVEVVSILAR